MSRDARVHPSLTLTLLAVAATSYILQQTLVVPALATIQRDLDASTTWTTWVFTGFLLSSAVATPLVGKLGDTFGKKRLLVVSLAVFLIGTLLAATAQSIAVLIIARLIQGAGGAIFPLSFGIVRDELPPARIGIGLGLLSATFGVGGGAGLVMSGVILESLDWQWLFWIGAIPVVVALALVWIFIPESPIRTPSRLDWQGALTLSAALVALLLALSEGESWGWLSTKTIVVFVAAVAFAVAWVLVELRVPQPMLDVRVMRDRTVFWTNAVAVLSGFAMFGTFLLVPTLVQMPAGLPPELAVKVDYGFGASVIVAGLYLLPASLVMLVVGPLGGLLEQRVGARVVTIAGLTILTFGGVILAVAHDAGWQIVIAMSFVGSGVGLAFAMMAKLMVDAVEPAITGVALGMNTVMRTIGGVIGGQIGAAVLSSNVIPGTPGVPEEAGFTITFLVAAAAAAAGAIAATLIPRRSARQEAGADPLRTSNAGVVSQPVEVEDGGPPASH